MGPRLPCVSCLCHLCPWVLVFSSKKMVACYGMMLCKYSDRRHFADAIGTIKNEGDMPQWEGSLGAGGAGSWHFQGTKKFAQKLFAKLVSPGPKENWPMSATIRIFAWMRGRRRRNLALGIGGLLAVGCLDEGFRRCLEFWVGASGRDSCGWLLLAGSACDVDDGSAVVTIRHMLALPFWWDMVSLMLMDCCWTDCVNWIDR